MAKNMIRTRNARRNVQTNKNHIRQLALGVLQSNMTGRRVKNPPFDPPLKPQTITVNWIHRRFQTLPTGGTLPISPSQIIAGGVPGTWSKLRVRKLTVWGGAHVSSSAGNTLPSVSMQWVTDGSTYEDDGTDGSRRPCVSVVAPLDQQLIWYPVSSTTQIAIISVVDTGTTTPIPFVFDVEIELMSTPSTIG